MIRTILNAPRGRDIRPTVSPRFYAGELFHTPRTGALVAVVAVAWILSILAS